MAVVTSNAKIITGSISNSLGTLGRSIFNSTIGTFADSGTMDQIYKAIEKLNSSIDTIDKTYDNEAVNGRNKADDLYVLLAGLDIKSSSDFMNKNRKFMERLMRLNKQEKDITLDALGVDVTGKSHIVKNENVKDYEYVRGNNYYEDYVKPLKKNQEIGDETTTLQLESSTHYNYSGLHNDLYVVNQNLYPDDENKGTFANKWIVENRNSLMYKTKKLFNAKKMNTIISRFHTNPYAPTSPRDNARSKYGLSHGRNLLTKEAEYGYSNNYANGYDNPYCRVWTHHHQYDRYYKTIRPFSSVDNQGNYVDTLSVQDFHQWSQFADSRDTNVETRGKWGWKKDSNNGWQYSVLQDNGKVNITPKYIRGEASNIHTKQCMFSIENLAWRGYDPYSFEQALSWEQRGPLGGRIMWFPPYGIQFNETTTTDWTSNTFLGRGEDVYTYANTRRTGTLSFMMVVDHPSIIDYVTWTNDNKNVTDTDILRFLAGCGEGDGSGFRDLAKPTPLTDEYTQVHDEIDIEEVKEIITNNEENATNPEDEKPLDDVLCFYVFYPNNYSGTYDDPDGDGHKIDGNSLVEPIPYLIAGKGAQKENGDYAKDLALRKETNYANTGNGYEMGKGPLGTDGGYISGTSLYPNTKQTNGKRRYWTELGTKNHSRSAKYSTGTKNCKKWYYRIDGRYAFPKDTIEEKIHYYNQTLVSNPPNSSYADEKDYGLNCNIEALSKAFSGEIQKVDKKYSLSNNTESQVFTLAEVAYVLYDNGKSDVLKGKCNITDNDRITELKKILSPERIKQIESVTAEGYASSHGYIEINEKLAQNRAKTASNWFIKTAEISVSPTVTKNDIDKNSGENEDTLNAKKWRSAKVIVKFKSVAKSTPPTSDYDYTPSPASSDEPSYASSSMVYGVQESESNVTSEEEQKNLKKNQGGKSYLGFRSTGEQGMYKGKMCDIYVDNQGKKWYKYTASNPAKYISVGYAKEEYQTPKARYGGNNTDENRLRYDQEYHFFKVLEKTDPVVYGSLMDKLKYFDPAFHSMTPEGFNGRLTFLQQCMRQGNTVSASDGKFAKSANNLAFGRAPYCVLRLGDFYNQLIVINNLSISYDPLVWDLNVEGIGVQPLIANVQLSFTFVGGGDMTGPVRRLQNAMSFNYYANTRLYDNRADRIERQWSDKTCGAIQHDEIMDDDNYKYNTTDEFKNTYNTRKGENNEVKSSSFYTTQMYK